MHHSLDRIDSNGHYEKDNLQVVCKFANRWKSASDNGEFKRLIEIIRSNGTFGEYLDNAWAYSLTGMLKTFLCSQHKYSSVMRSASCSPTAWL